MTATQREISISILSGLYQKSMSEQPAKFFRLIRGALLSPGEIMQVSRIFCQTVSSLQPLGSVAWGGPQGWFDRCLPPGGHDGRALMEAVVIHKWVIMQRTNHPPCWTGPVFNWWNKTERNVQWPAGGPLFLNINRSHCLQWPLGVLKTHLRPTDNCRLQHEWRFFVHMLSNRRKLDAMSRFEQSQAYQTKKSLS